MSLRRFTERGGAWIQRRRREMAEAAARGIGQAATLVSVAASMFVNGELVEERGTQQVHVEGPHDEQRRYSASGLDTRGVTATFYLPSKGLAFVPKPGDRIVIGDRSYVVVELRPRFVRSVPISYRLDCGEVASG